MGNRQETELVPFKQGAGSLLNTCFYHYQAPPVL